MLATGVHCQFCVSICESRSLNGSSMACWINNEGFVNSGICQVEDGSMGSSNEVRRFICPFVMDMVAG